jgi:hypothetical protein
VQYVEGLRGEPLADGSSQQRIGDWSRSVHVVASARNLSTFRTSTFVGCDLSYRH